MTAAPSIFLGSPQILVQNVRLVVKYLLHYFLSPSPPIPGGPHGLFTNGHCAINSALILVKLGSAVRGEFKLSFALLSASSEHHLPKDLSQIFAPIPGGSHTWNYLGTAAAPSILLRSQ
jgi:hypothetical protein